MYKNRDKKGRFIKGHKTNIGKKNALGTRYKKPDSFGKMMSKKMKGNKINLGRKFSEEHKRKISEAKKGTNMGAAHSNWKGGIYSNLKKYRREYMREYSPEYRKNNSEKIKGWSKKYREAHPEEHKRCNRKWRAAHPAEYNLLQKRYIARKKGAQGFHTLEEWKLLKKHCDYRCLICGKREPLIKLEEDHIVPLSKNGSDYIKNIQPLCRSCNATKGGRTEFKAFNSQSVRLINR